MSAPRVKSPPRLFLSFFLPVLSLVRPRRRLSPAPTAYCRRPARADAVKAGRSSAATPSGGLAFTAIEHDGRLDGSGRLRSCCLFYPRLRVSARVIPITDVFWQALATKSMAACDNRINLYPAAPIRLAKVLLAWTIAQAGWGSSF